MTIPPEKITKGADVKATLAAVSTGDADAAIVYVTDAKAAGATVQAVRIPAWLNVYAIYPIAPIAASENQDLAKAWIEYTASPAGQKTLQRFGFLPAAAPVSRRGRGVPLVAVAPRSRRGRLLRSSAGRALPARAVGRALGRPQRTRGARRDAPVARVLAVVDRSSRWCSACRSRGCSPARDSPADRSCARWSCCRWCCRRSSAALRCSSRSSATTGSSADWIYDSFGVQFTFSKWGSVLAETFVAMPFLVITVEAGLRTMDRRYEDAAASLGAGRWTVFRRVTLPLIAPALIAGAALAWARALGEFGATITFAGNIQGRTQTMPLAVYNLLESEPGRRDRAQPGAARRLDRRAGLAARPLVRRPA